MGLAVLFAIAGAATADAASITASSGGFTYAAAVGEGMELDATVDGRELVLADTAATALTGRLPNSCTSTAADVGIAIRCDAPGPQTLRLTGGESGDRISAWQLPRRVSLLARLGNGDNIVEGGSGDDDIRGGDDRDTLYGGPGTDLLVGGDGNNYLRGNGGDDIVRGGAGALDFLIGDGGNDSITGGAGVDYITGGGGDDQIDAGADNDDIGAGAGDDVILGGGGDDELRGGTGADRFAGGAGADLLRARDGEGDDLDCGAGGDDIARIDGLDDANSKTCEKIRTADTATTEPVDVNAPTF